MPDSFKATRVDSIERLIPRTPVDVSSLRASFAAMVTHQWERHVPPNLGHASVGSGLAQTAKVRFMAGMYARACYSMLLLSPRGPFMLRSPVRIAVCGTWSGPAWASGIR